MFAGEDGQVDVFEDDAVAGGYGDVAHVEEGWFGGLVGWDAGGGLGGHLC